MGQQSTWQDPWRAGPTELTRYEVSTHSIQAARQRSRKLPHQLAILFVLLAVFASPIAFGGHQSVTWLAFAFLQGAFGAVYFATLKGPATLAPLSLGLFRLLLVLAAFAFLQGGAHYFLKGGSVFASWTPRDSIVASLRLAGLAFLVLILGTALASLRLPRKRIAQIFSVTAFVMFGSAAGAMLLQGIHFPSAGGLTGTFANKNSFATFLGIGFILSVSLAMRAPNQAQTWPARNLRFCINWAVVVTLAIGLISTQSRMGISATVCAVIVVVLLQNKGSRKTWMLLVALASGMSLALVGGPVLERFTMLSGDWTTRAQFYEQILGMIAERPFAGFGADSFALAYERYHQPPVSLDFVWDRTHSTYLKLWAELGVIIGSLPLLAGIFGVGILLRRCWFQPSAASAAALGSLILVGLHSTVDFSIEILANQLTLVLIIVLADYDHHARQQRSKRHEK